MTQIWLLGVRLARIIEGVKPHCFVMENVDRARKSNAYAKAREIFKRAGYGLTEIVLACRGGVMALP